MHTALFQGGLAPNLYSSGFVADCRDEFVVNDDNGFVLDAALDNEVGNTSSVGKRGDVSANLVERQAEVAGQRAHELGFGLVADDHDGGRGVNLSGLALLGEKRRLGGASEGAARGLGHGGVDTTAEPLVGGDDNEELFGRGCGRG